MKRSRSGFLGVFFVLGSLFFLSGCTSSEESKLADLFQEDQVYYMANSPADEPEFTIKKNADGSLLISNIEKGISENMNYTVEEQEKGLYHYKIANSENYGIFEVLDNFVSDQKDFNVFIDEKNDGYAFVPISKNFSKNDSSLSEVKAIYNDDPQFFVGKYKE